MEHGIEETSQGTVYEPGEMIRVIDGPFNDFSKLDSIIGTKNFKLGPM